MLKEEEGLQGKLEALITAGSKHNDIKYSRWKRVANMYDLYND